MLRGQHLEPTEITVVCCRKFETRKTKEVKFIPRYEDLYLGMIFYTRTYVPTYTKGKTKAVSNQSMNTILFPSSKLKLGTNFLPRYVHMFD
jgi:hypothetical protein